MTGIPHLRDHVLASFVPDMTRGSHSTGFILQSLVSGAKTAADFGVAFDAARATGNARAFKRALCGWLHARHAAGFSKTEARQMFSQVWGHDLSPRFGSLANTERQFQNVAASLRVLKFQ